MLEMKRPLLIDLEINKFELFIITFIYTRRLTAYIKQIF